MGASRTELESVDRHTGAVLVSKGVNPHWANQQACEAEQHRVPEEDSELALSGPRRLGAYLSTAMQLGIGNIARVAVHRALKKGRIYKALAPRRAPREKFPVDLRVETLMELPAGVDRSVLAEADELLAGRAAFFSVHSHYIGNPPDWFRNPFQNARHPQPRGHWSEIREFSSKGEDIKIIWEMSRFSWVLVLARAWRISGEERYLSALQLWIRDWWERNPPNTGPNWMCGQEASIRLINTLLALRVAGWRGEFAGGLTEFVEAHCRRIRITTLYAVGQDNNHGTSEATALFVGGTWLAKYGAGDIRHRGGKWARLGRRLLEKNVARLFLQDGSFSQHSLTYHRLALETLSIAESWRRFSGASPFTAEFYARAAAATRWLKATIDLETGDGPNLGANDGAQPYRLHSGAYRDFRPCLQLSSEAFDSEPALDPGPWDEPAAWLGFQAECKQRRAPGGLTSKVFPDGGYAVLRNESGVAALLRAPTARFRPSHADALHLDLWWKGENILRDGGTYSYADGGAVRDSLASAIGHNVPQFDDHDQMPRLSRFLYGNWIRVEGADRVATGADEGQSWTGRYTDSWGAEHTRTVELKGSAVRVMDHVRGFRRRATLRWRLAPENWRLAAMECFSAKACVRVESTVPIVRLSLKSAWESRHYLECSTIPVLEVEIRQSPALLTTTISLF